ncbi:MAG: flippase-like domain-containing protein [Oscillospiraceae bacterium]|nr:flippase-like domain-containing protein [Oscillospiraceae bacterium]
MKLKWIFAPILLVLLGVALWQIDLAALWHSLLQIPLWLIILLPLLQIASQLLVNLQWYAISNSSGVRIRFWRMFYVNCQGAVVDSITPGVKVGGEVTRAVRLRQEADCSTEQAVAVVAVQKMFSFAAFFAISLLAVGYIIAEIPHLWAALAGVLAIIALATLAAYIFRRKLRTFFRTLREQVETLKQNRKLLAGLILLSLVIWIMYPVKLCLLVAQVSSISIFHVAAVTFAAYMVAMLPIFPGGLGGFEGTMSSLLLTFGVAVGDAVAVTIVFRFVTFWFVMILALGVLAVNKSISFRLVPKKRRDNDKQN